MCLFNIRVKGGWCPFVCPVPSNKGSPFVRNARIRGVPVFEGPPEKQFATCRSELSAQPLSATCRQKMDYFAAIFSNGSLDLNFLKLKQLGFSELEPRKVKTTLCTGLVTETKSRPPTIFRLPCSTPWSKRPQIRRFKSKQPIQTTNHRLPQKW